MEERFPAERAARTVQHLAGTIGLRIPGQPGFQEALDWLRGELESIPGWEVDVQEAAAAREWRKTLTGTCHVNLVARLPGTEPGAILVNSHLDSPPSSVGAADDGAAVAVMLEAARLLSAGPRPRRSVVFLFNGSEEYGLQGALSFLEQHRWAKDVAAFINLEAAGCDGPFTLFQTSPKLPALLRAYRSVPRPSGSVVGQDLFEAKIFSNDTDYRVFTGHGLHGVDLALTGDGYAYHSWRDQPERVTRRALQEMGDTLMGLLGRLDREPDLRPREQPAASVYFDVAGRFFVSYPKRLAPALLAMAAVLGTFAVWGLPWWSGLLRHLGATLAALLLPAGAAWAMGKLTRTKLWWFAHPAPTGAAWVCLALAGMAGVQALFPLPTPVGMAGVVFFWLLLGGTAVWKGSGSAYLPMAWAVSGAAGLLLWPLSPVAAVAVAVGGGAVVAATAIAELIRFMLGHLGRNALPSHLIVAVLFGFTALAVGAFLPLPSIALWLAPAAVALLAVAALLPPFTAERPEQFGVVDLWYDGGSRRVWTPYCGEFSPAIRRTLGEKLLPPGEPLWKGHLMMGKAAVATACPAAASGPVDPPVLEVLRDETGETRSLTVRCVSTGYAVVLSTDADLLEIAVDAGAGRPVLRGKQNRLRFVNPPPEGIVVTMTLPAGVACRLTASSWYLQETGPDFPPGTSVLHQRAAVVDVHAPDGVDEHVSRADYHPFRL